MRCIDSAKALAIGMKRELCPDDEGQSSKHKGGRLEEDIKAILSDHSLDAWVKRVYYDTGYYLVRDGNLSATLNVSVPSREAFAQCASVDGGDEKKGSARALAALRYRSEIATSEGLNAAFSSDIERLSTGVFDGRVANASALCGDDNTTQCSLMTLPEQSGASSGRFEGSFQAAREFSEFFLLAGLSKLDENHVAFGKLSFSQVMGTGARLNGKGIDLDTPLQLGLCRAVNLFVLIGANLRSHFFDPDPPNAGSFVVMHDTDLSIMRKALGLSWAPVEWGAFSYVSPSSSLTFEAYRRLNHGSSEHPQSCVRLGEHGNQSLPRDVVSVNYITPTPHSIRSGTADSISVDRLLPFRCTTPAILSHELKDVPVVCSYGDLMRSLLSSVQEPACVARQLLDAYRHLQDDAAVCV